MTRITVVIEDHAEGVHLGQQLAGGRVVGVRHGDREDPGIQDALEMLTDAVEQTIAADQRDPRLKACVKLARAAITKARGQ